ncbi:MAG TPA: hypothetical protein VI815_00140 [Candidatus Nanoarchaeia archaeon]|nr:hypothetical protein [Candidatus Nanoarchaeia archaeon]
MKKENNQKREKRVTKPLFVIGLMLIVSTALFISMISFASAEFWQCFADGERIDFCGNIPDRTSPSNNYKLCMDAYNSNLGCWAPGNWNVCNTLAPTCGINGGNSTQLDITPPVITLLNPQNNALYNSRNVPFAFTLDERSDVYYLDLINGRGRWSRICSNCMSYNRARSFKDGMNNIRIKAIDNADNEGFVEVTFFVDSQKPRIYSTMPRSRFASGLFNVQYTELNLKKVNLTYGNELSGFNSINLAGCLSGTKMACNTTVNLNNYNGEEISYMFSVEDNAGSVVNSRTVSKLKVDTQVPVVNSMNYTINGKYVTFVFNVTEDNLDVIQYMDTTESRPRFRSMCTRLVDGMCTKKISLRNGHHDLIIEILDDAGNRAERSASIDIVL